MHPMENRPGTYVLQLRLPARASIEVGRLGRLVFKRGIYCYVGSAFGPGGVRARVCHHARPARRPHWHIDYLRRAARLESVWFSHAAGRREHRWARALLQLSGAVPGLDGFGASDCDCAAHLMWFPGRDALHAAWERLLADTPDLRRVGFAPLLEACGGSAKK